MKMQDLLALPAQALKGNIGFWIFNDQDNHKPRHHTNHDLDR